MRGRGWGWGEGRNSRMVLIELRTVVQSDLGMDQRGVDLLEGDVLLTVHGIRAVHRVLVQSGGWTVDLWPSQDVHFIAGVIDGLLGELVRFGGFVVEEGWGDVRWGSLVIDLWSSGCHGGHGGRSVPVEEVRDGVEVCGAGEHLREERRSATG